MKDIQKAEEMDRLYNQIVLDEFQTNPAFRERAGFFSVKKTDPKKENGLMMSLKPKFNTERQEKTVKVAVETIMTGLHKIEKALAKGDKRVQDCMGLEDEEVEMLRFPLKYQNRYPFVRFDAALDKNAFKVIEINLNCPGGPGVIDQATEQFDQLSTIRKLKKIKLIRNVKGYNDELLKVLMRCFRESGGREKKPNIIILQWKEDQVVSFETLDISLSFQKKGHRVRIVDPREVEYSEGCLAHEGFRSNLILKWFDIEVLWREKEAYVALLKVLREGSVVLVNPMSAAVMATKSSFAVMTSPEFRHLFTSKERAVFGKHVPWTRLFEEKISTDATGKKIELVDFALKKRESVVLKPAVGTYGREVHVGISYAEKDWEEKVRNIIKSPERYIIQERAVFSVECFPAIRDGNLIFERKKIDILPMLFYGKFFGSFSRCAPGYILNGYQGGIGALNYTIIENINGSRK